MKLQVKKDSRQVAITIAEIIRAQLIKKPDSLLCIAAGHTQLETLEILAEWHRKKEVDFRRCRIIGLDDWVGLHGYLPGTCRHFINTNILVPLNISSERCFIFDACSDDLDGQCVEADMFLDKHGPIDLTVLGVGMNAHLGFNEPGVCEQLRSHIIELDNTTRSVGTKYFKTTVNITHGITLGLKDLLSASTVIVQATGMHKSSVVKEICEGEITNIIPASLVRKLPNAFMFIDTAAASKLTNQ